MSIVMYGTLICEDCVEALEYFKKHKVEVEFRSFNEKTDYIKEFLKYRDTLAIFDAIRAENKIGIPCFVVDEDLVTLDIEEVMRKIGRKS